MKINWLSTTFIKNWTVCQMRTMFDHEKRVDTEDDDFGSSATRFGTLVHNTAERVHKGEIMGEALDPMEVFQDELGKSQGINWDYFSFGYDVIGDFIDRTLYDRQGQTVSVEMPFLLDIVHMEIHDISDMDIDEVKKLAAKMVKRGGVPVRSMIDRIDKVAETEYEVYDYKSNYQPFSRDEVEESTQLALYHMAVKALYPEATKIRCVFDMVRHGRFPTIFDSERLEKLRVYMVGIWNQVRNSAYPVPELNKFCSWCDYKGNCPEYIEAMNEDYVNAIQIMENTENDSEALDSLYAAYRKLKTVEKLAKERSKEFSAVAMEAIRMNGGKPIPIGDGESELYLQANPRYNYPIDEVWPVFERFESLSILRKALSISKPTLERAMKGRTKLIEAVEPLMETDFVSPSLRKRKVKK